MLAFKYISFHYLKYFFIILLALVMFLVGFDYMENAEKLSKSANLILIYLVYKSFFAIDMLLPIALIFSMITTKIHLIRSNALVSFYSLGYSKVDVLKPFFVVSSGVVILFIYLHSLSSFSRADEFSNNIRKYSEYLSPTRNLFFTFENKYVYFSRMLPLQEKAEDIRVFTVNNNSLKEVLFASVATYKDESWLIKDADIIIKPDEMSYDSLGIKVVNKKNLSILNGFRPKMLDQVYEGKVNFTITDAIEAILLLKDQKIDVSSVKGALYKIFIYPFFVPFTIVIIFFFVPISTRGVNITLFSFIAIISTLLTWGVLFMFQELSINKTLPSEVGIVFPVVILGLVAFRQWRKYRLST